MAIDSKDAQIIRSLIPLATLSAPRFEKLCRASHIEEAPRGAMLFHQGDHDKEYVYLLEGTIVLRAGGVDMDTIQAGLETARFALAHQIPRKVSAIANNKVRFIRIEPRFLQVAEEKKQGPSSYHVSDIPQESPHDWMTALLRLPLFQQLPAAHLQKLLMELEEVRVKSGQRVLVQGEPGDYYYIVKKGRCALSRKPSEHAKDIVLARLKACDAFGEEALISAEPCQLSATMLTDGKLLRLDRARFLESIKEPLIHSIDFDTSRLEPSEQSTLLDVRAPEEFEQKHLRDSINLPFFSLPMQLTKLDKKKRHIVVCNDGKISETTAFLLIKNGFRAVVLKEGLNKVPEEYLHTAPHKATSGILVNVPKSNAQQGASPTQEQVMEAPGDARSPVRQTPEKQIEQAVQSSDKPSEEAYEAPSPGAQDTTALPAETAEPTEELAILRQRIEAFEEERTRFRAQVKQHQLEMSTSLRSLRERLDTAMAERQALNEQLTEKTEIIAELESAIRALREKNSSLERQHIKRSTTPATDKEERSSEVQALRPDRAMSRR